MSTRRLRSLATRVLAIFVATICVALLAPAMATPDYALVCSAQGDHWVASSASMSQPFDSHADPLAHCPLCMPAGVPPMAAAWDFTPVQPLAHVLRSIPAARLASLVGASLPARGPPTLS